MILYFANRNMDILGTASTELPKGLTIVSDKKVEDVDAGVATFEGRIAFNAETRELAEKYCAVGNYLLRSHNGENGFFTIIDSELDTKAQEVTIYAEDAGLDLLNEISVAYSADKAYPISHYIEKFAYDSGFEIGINEASDLSRQLSWDGESTVAERIASVATQFDGCEVSYSFEINGLKVVKKFINIYRERGSETGVQLRLNKEVDRIISKKTIANLATALKVEGGTPEGGETPINLNGYSYDDGDIFLEGTYLKSRSAVAIWSRYLSESGNYTGHIMRTFTYDTTSQSELCNRAVAELRKISQIEANYEADVIDIPQNVRVGDRISIIDDAGELYVSTRVLKLEESATNMSKKAIFGEFLMQDDGINEDVARLAAQFSKSSQSAAKALKVAKEAKADAESAQTQANTAVGSAANAQAKADAAEVAANSASASAASAQAKADAAEEAVNKVEEQVSSIVETVDDANAAAEQARQAALNAETKASEAQTAALEAKEQAAAAEEAAGVAKTTSETAIAKSETATTTADQAKQEAATAKATADAAKLDAEQAKEDVAEFEESLTTLSNTMEADYARKTELTETEASLQSQITQNAGQIQSTVEKVLKVDETANNAAEQAAQAQTTAAAAQTQADKATEDAEAAQQAADAAALAATNAQSEADKAKAAAATAQSVADKAEEDLAAAEKNLADVTSRVDATEEDIAAAQQAVETAQAAADKAKADAADATSKANAAQSTADTAVTNAATAQTKANEAASAAALAQQTADAAKGDAAAAQDAADKAAADAAEAQKTADTAVTNAANAQTKANEAAAAAAAAQTAADEADAKAQQAEDDLAAAEKNLADVTSRVDATEEEVEAAQAAVETAQAKADEANAAAVAARGTADAAKADAAKAQTDADNAKTAADAAQKAADDAQKAADDAQKAVDALAVRVTKTETDIIQTSEQIALLATKEEVTETLGGYYTKSEADAAIKVSADNINLSASNTYQTKAAMSAYSTTAEMNAAIKVESDRISTVVDEQTNQGERLTALDQKVDSISLKYIDSAGNETSFKLTNGAIDITLLKTQIDDAAATATNFISMTGNGGIEVGNKSGESWKGYRSQMLADSFKIVDENDRELASYEANAIYLGKSDNQDTVIDFNNGMVTLSYDADHYRAMMKANRMYITSHTGYEILIGSSVSDAEENVVGGQVYCNLNGVHMSGHSGNTYMVDLYSDIYLRNDGKGLWESVGADNEGYIQSCSIEMWPNKLQIRGRSQSVQFVKGRDGAVLTSINAPTSSQYFPITSVKSVSGSYEIGTYNNNLMINYASDANYNAGNNTVTGVTIGPGGAFEADGGVYVGGNIFQKNGSGSDVAVLTMLNSRVDISLGYGSYDSGVGSTYIMGGEHVYFRSGTEAMYFFPCYKNSAAPYSVVIGDSGDRHPNIHPGVTGGWGYVGTINNKWKAVYATTGTIQTSDRRLKRNISEDYSRFEKMILSLRPVSFDFIDLDDGIERTGFIAQEVLDVLSECNIDPQKTLFVINDKVDPDGELGKLVEDDHVFGMNYEQFIVPTIYVVQKDHAEIEDLKRRVAELEKRIA